MNLDQAQPFYPTSQNLLNICQQDDPFARYQMPDLELRQKHQLTFWTNIHTVSQALKISPQLLGKYLSQSLSTMTKYIQEQEELQINGLFTKDHLYIHLRKCLTDWVICPQCGLPELGYKAKKKTLRRACRSCGFKQEMDPKADRLTKWYTTQLLANPQANIPPVNP